MTFKEMTFVSPSHDRTLLYWQNFIISYFQSMDEDLDPDSELDTNIRP
jgi:hypothetical protein